jgi:hypothetical protein
MGGPPRTRKTATKERSAASPNHSLPFFFFFPPPYCPAKIFSRGGRESLRPPKPQPPHSRHNVPPLYFKKGRKGKKQPWGARFGCVHDDAALYINISLREIKK